MKRARVSIGASATLIRYGFSYIASSEGGSQLPRALGSGDGATDIRALKRCIKPDTKGGVAAALSSASARNHGQTTSAFGLTEMLDHGQCPEQAWALILLPSGKTPWTSWLGEGRHLCRGSRPRCGCWRAS